MNLRILMMAVVLAQLFAVLVGAQSATEIYLFDLSLNGREITLSQGRNISNHPGYDNQPYFHPDKPLLYYASFNDEGRSDIKVFDWESRTTSHLTTTREREYSPTLTPDGRHVSCIIQRDDGAQDLGQYSVDGGEAITLIDNRIVGYHAWVDQQSVILFVLSDPFSLQYHNLETGESKTIAENIGRSFHAIPGGHGMSFVQKYEEKPWSIRRWDPQSGQVTDITEVVAPNREDLAWLPDGRILMSDGTDLKVHDPNDAAGGWNSVELPSNDLRGINRIAVRPDGRKIALVVDE